MTLIQEPATVIGPAITAPIVDKDNLIAEQRATIAQQQITIAEQKEIIIRLQHANDQLQVRLQALEKAVAAITSRVVSQGTEVDAQGQEYIPGILAAEQEAQRAAEAAAAAAVAAQTQKVDGRSLSKHARGGRLKALDLEKLEKVVVLRELPPEQRLAADGTLLQPVGEAILSDLLAYIPGKYVRRIEKAVTYASAAEPEAAPIRADPAPRVIPGGQVHDSVLIQLFVMTFADPVPVYRQEAMAQRLGVPLTRGTLVRWVNRFCHALETITDAIAAELLAQPLLHLDDTTYRLIFPIDPDRKKPGKSHLGRMWGLATLDAVWFLYTDTREGRHVQSLLSDVAGILVGDDYRGRKKTLAMAAIIAVYCWAHVLRKFRDCADTIHAPGIVARIRMLYQIEDEIHQLPTEQRLEARRSRSTPIVDELDRRIDALLPLTTPKQDLGAACRYAHRLREGLRRFLDDPAIPLDNNTCERAMRPVAIGRKNRLFAISEVGAEAAAIGFTIAECCRRAKADPQAYLSAIVPRLLAGEDPAGLTPAAWAASQLKAAEATAAA